MDEKENPAENAEETVEVAEDQGSPEADEVTEADDESAEEGDEEVFVDDESEAPPVAQRKTNKDFIIARKNRKIAKLQKEAEEADEDGGQEGTEDQEDLDLSGLEPIIKNHIDAEDAREVDAFLAENPDFAIYKAKVMRWMKDESRRALPVEDIFFSVAGRAMMKIGAERAKKAELKAKQTQVGGGSNREAMKPKEVWKMSNEEFEAEQLRVRRG